MNILRVKVSINTWITDKAKRFLVVMWPPQGDPNPVEESAVIIGYGYNIIIQWFFNVY